ncbi:hypothetical protein BsWGS_04286 [Bradybaena similaris]
MARYDVKLPNLQISRRLSINSFMIRVYSGALSDELEYVSVESDKSTCADDVVSVACRKLRLGNGSDVSKQFELAEVFSSGGQLCKERRLDSTENPVALQLLWPKMVASSENETGASGLFDGYRFYLRRRDPVGSVGGWIVRDQSAVDSFLLSFLTQPIAGKEFPDLCSLPDLNERTLLHNLKARFYQKNIYTYVGSILIAVNPFKFFPIYNPKYVSMYQNKQLGELPPHIFAVADAAYHSMLRQKKSQCIVISGESGSGKTESTNLLLHHLTALSHKGLHGSGVEQTILGAGPVLEAFGNAKTVHNNNSSRFGKFIQVNYKQNGMVHGAIVEKYLLEKSRIVFQARGERNYHVFYYLLAGADEQEREMFRLVSADKYNYLSQSACYSVDGVDEKYEFARLKQSMEMVGFSHETQRKIFSVLSAVLHLGNVDFKKKGDKHHDEFVAVKNEEAVKTISMLLKVKEQYVLEALTQKKTTAGDETFVISYRMEDAIATRDAMAKCIYGALFDWIVLKVNQALLAKKHDSEHEGDSIGVLDIFGFEDFGINSFEQFCINYANEHLQYYFNQHIFKFEQEEYQREGIQWRNIEFIDNTGSLELFSKRPNGLFSLLDEECSFPAATNETLLNKFTHHHKNNPHYQVPQLKEEVFSIMHYAGKVKYFVKDFREKNLDLVRPEIVATLKMSSMAFVRELMGIDPVAVLRWSIIRAFFRCYFGFIKAGETYRKTGGKDGHKQQRRVSDNSVQDAFNENLLRFYHVASTASVLRRIHFGSEVAEHLLSQIRSGQNCNTPLHKGHLHKELQLYCTLTNGLSEDEAKNIRKAGKLLMKNKSFRPKQRPSLSFRDIKALKVVASHTMTGSLRGTGSKKQPPTVGTQFQWSLSRLMNTLNQANPYFIRCIKSNTEKAPCVFDEELVMRQLRYTGMLATVKIRQSGYNYRLLLNEFTKLYKILLPRKQQHTKEDIKNFLTSMGLKEENYQIGMTKIFLRESEKMQLDEALHSAIMKRVVTIQTWVKACLDRKAFLRSKESIICIQKSIRRFLAQQDFQKYQLYQLHIANALKIQTFYRCYIERQKFLAQRTALVYIQSCIRAAVGRRKFIEQRDVNARLAKETAERKIQERLEMERKLLEKEQENEKLRVEAEKVKQEEMQRKEELIREKLEEEQMLAERLELDKQEKKDELQSTASDEGVLLKASSTEELEEKDFHSLSRRDSEESSGIMDGSDTEVALIESPTKTMIDTPPPTPDSKRSCLSEILSEKSEIHISRVQEIAKAFQKAHEEEAAQSMNESQHPADTPRKPTELKVSRIPLLPDDKRREIEAVISHKKDMIKKREEVGDFDDHANVYLSPLHKAKRHWKNWVGGTKKKKDDSEEESEDSISLQSKRVEAIGINVLPQIPLSALPPITKEKQLNLMPDESAKSSHWNHRRQKKKQQRSRVNDKNASVSPGGSQSRSNMKVARSTEWQYAENMVITDVTELSCLDEFISQKQMELYRDTNRHDTVFDRIFKGALEKFRKDLKALKAVESHKENPAVRYRDLFEKFRYILEAEMKQDKTDAPLVMSVNAFRGFLDEFRKQEEARSRENKKDDRLKEKRAMKREKHKKAQETIDYNGHKYQQIQFNIPTFCEVCTSLIWIMDKVLVCQDCKLACHKKCYSKHISPCKGIAEGRGQTSNQLFGAELDCLVSDRQRVPLVCERLMSTLENTGIYVEGIYRKPGSAPKIKELKAALESDVEAVILENYHVHVLASVLKLFLRNLPEPLLTFDLYDDFLRTTEIKDEKELIKSLFDVLRKLPRANFDLFERLCFHLACVAMHSDSNKMSANALAVIFAPVVLGTNKKLQAQDAIALMPQQMMCIELILKEQINTVKSKLEDINILENAEKTTGERLKTVRASLHGVKVENFVITNVKEIEEESEPDMEQSELAKEEKVLARHLLSINKEKDKITCKLPHLEVRQTSSDEDVLSGDETDATEAAQEEYAVNFDMPVRIPSLKHVTKDRANVPKNRRLPHRFAKRIKTSCMDFEDSSEACLPEPIPTITIKQTSKAFSHYFDTMTVESSYLTIPEILGIADEDEIMV